MNKLLQFIFTLGAVIVLIILEENSDGETR